MSDIKIESYEVDRNVSLSVYNDQISIRFKGMNKLATVNYTDELFEIIKKARFRVSDNPRKIDKYPYSNEYNKTLHQIAYDYYFGEALRKEVYKSGYIIEHLDNDGFNCDISNLFILKKIKNTYKGWTFDKKAKEALPIFALKIHHIFSNKTFQITIAFNESFVNPTSEKAISKIRLLYDYNYEIVLQDAEQILESIVETHIIDFKNWTELYRFKDVKITHSPDFELSEEEKNQPYGTFIIRDGNFYLIVGQSEESVGLITSIPYEKDWGFKD